MTCPGKARTQPGVCPQSLPFLRNCQGEREVFFCMTPKGPGREVSFGLI